MSDCHRCGTENVETTVVSIVEGNRRFDADLCEFCGAIPGGVIRTSEGIALAIVANILRKEIRAVRDTLPRLATKDDG